MSLQLSLLQLVPPSPARPVPRPASSPSSNTKHTPRHPAQDPSATETMTGEVACDVAYGVTSHTTVQADAAGVLATNRGPGPGE